MILKDLEKIYDKLDKEGVWEMLQMFMNALKSCYDCSVTLVGIDGYFCV